jgi:hypothetical protein
MDSRYIRIVKTPIEKRKKVVKIHGAFEDNGKYFYCWNCHSINSVDRNVGFTGLGADPIDFDDPYVPSQGHLHLPGKDQANVITLDEISPSGNTGTLSPLGPDGNPIQDYYTPRSSNVSKGCWFCGATNIFGGQSN